MIAALLAALALAGAQDAAAAPEPATEAEPSFFKALENVGLEPKTKLEDGVLQVMLGQRAVLGFDAARQPVLLEVEAGRIDRAAKPDDPEILKGVGPLRLGIALDASPQKRLSIMKVWNGQTYPIAFDVEIAALRKGQLMRKKEPLCAVPAGGAIYQTWPDPIIAVTVSSLGAPPADTPACRNEKD